MNVDLDNSACKGEVLVVDDTPGSLLFIADLLGAEGYSVRTAPSGELALWTLSSRCADLILLDVRMPVMDGFEVCRRLKAIPESANIPIIFLSAQYDVEDKLRGFRAGGVDYIAKPFAGEEVLQRVATHMHLAKISQELQLEKLSLEGRVEARTKDLLAEIAVRKKAQAELRLASVAFNASVNSVMITDAEGRMVAVNPACVATLGYPADECLGQTARLFNSDRHDPAFFREMWLSLASNDKWTGEVWCRRKDGNVFPSLQHISTVRSDSGAVSNYVCVLLDLSEAKDAQTLIEFLTRHDPLTGLPNRVLVRDRFDQLLGSLDGSCETLGVIALNLDRFRFINDFHGHAVGDAILRWVSTQLSACLTSTELVFRESGDEFVLVHRDKRGLLGIQLLAECLLSHLLTEVSIDGVPVGVSASLGLSVYPTDGKTLEELTSNALIAMKRAKEQGGETFAFFTETIDQGVRDRFDIAQRLRHALDRAEFEVYYQPQVEATSGKIVAAEALLRWRTPELGFVSPAQFIPVAEDTGRITEIGEWVLQSVCAQIKRWSNEGHGHVKVAVNLSAKQFMREDLCQTVRASLNNSGIPPEFLELEITEGAVIEDVQRAINTMQELKAMGVTISLDDFGTGYSSLSYLKKFPIDYLKVDQSFVRDLFTDRDADAIVLSIIGLARNMRLKVIAEGVEDAKQKQFLAQNGCHLLQGFLFSKPVPADEFLAKLLEQR